MLPPSLAVTIYQKGLVVTTVMLYLHRRSRLHRMFPTAGIVTTVRARQLNQLLFSERAYGHAASEPQIAS